MSEVLPSTLGVLRAPLTWRTKCCVESLAELLHGLAASVMAKQLACALD